MPNEPSIPYHLRPNKAVDREVFLDLLVGLGPSIGLRDYQYIGLGGPFMEDFRLIHSRTSIRRMTCVEREENTHHRQRFNLPLSLVTLVHDNLETYLNALDLGDTRTVIWLDHTDPGDIRERFDFVADIVMNVAPESIVRITLNAHPQQLGGEGGSDGGRRNRLETLQKNLGNYLPQGTEPEDLKRRRFGGLLLRALRLGLETRLQGSGSEFVGVCSFLYADGQPMVSVTGVSVETGHSGGFLERTGLREWEFYRPEWWDPEVIDVPLLSTRERLRIEQLLHQNDGNDVPQALGFELPGSGLADDADALTMFRRYYRLYPHFGRIDL